MVSAGARAGPPQWRGMVRPGARAFWFGGGRRSEADKFLSRVRVRCRAHRQRACGGGQSDRGDPGLPRLAGVETGSAPMFAYLLRFRLDRSRRPGGSRTGIPARPGVVSRRARGNGSPAVRKRRTREGPGHADRSRELGQGGIRFVLAPVLGRPRYATTRGAAGTTAAVYRRRGRRRVGPFAGGCPFRAPSRAGTPHPRIRQRRRPAKVREQCFLLGALPDRRSGQRSPSAKVSERSGRLVLGGAGQPEAGGGCARARRGGGTGFSENPCFAGRRLPATEEV